MAPAALAVSLLILACTTVVVSFVAFEWKRKLETARHRWICLAAEFEEQNEHARVTELELRARAAELEASARSRERELAEACRQLHEARRAAVPAAPPAPAPPREEYRSTETERDAYRQEDIAGMKLAIAQVENLIHEGVARITNSFGALEQKVAEQAAIARSVAGEGGGALAGGANSAPAAQALIAHTQSAFRELIDQKRKLSANDQTLLALIARFETGLLEAPKVIADIEEIARRTRLAALDASVDAARSDDAGRGFTDIAGEVRLLAALSSAVSSEVRRILGELHAETGVARRRLHEIAAPSGASILHVMQTVQVRAREIEIAHQKTAGAVAQLGALAGEAAQDIHDAVPAFEFRDLACRLLAYVGEVVEQLANEPAAGGESAPLSVVAGSIERF